jgi:tetratricopeptide (TPR) repeat protein
MFNQIVILLMSCFLLVTVCQVTASGAGTGTTNAVAMSAPSQDGLSRMREMLPKRQYKELVAEFQDVDFSSWGKSAADAFCQRGRAYAALKDGEKAEADFKKALELSPGNGWFWNCLADNCRDNLQDNQKAVEAYLKCFELDKQSHQGKTSYSFLPVSAIVSAARILYGQGKYAEALKVLDSYQVDDIEKLGKYWHVGLLRAYAQVYLGQGREAEALVKFKEALELEKK